MPTDTEIRDAAVDILDVPHGSRVADLVTLLSAGEMGKLQAMEQAVGLA